MMVMMMILVIFSEDTGLYLYSHWVVDEEYFCARDLPCSPTLCIIR